jgi:hypothetical protein
MVVSEANAVFCERSELGGCRVGGMMRFCASCGIEPAGGEAPQEAAAILVLKNGGIVWLFLVK